MVDVHEAIIDHFYRVVLNYAALGSDRTSLSLYAQPLYFDTTMQLWVSDRAIRHNYLVHPSTTDIARCNQILVLSCGDDFEMMVQKTRYGPRPLARHYEYAHPDFLVQAESGLIQLLDTLFG